MRWLVRNHSHELARLETCPALCGVVARPLGCILAGGLAVVVSVREVEDTAHFNGNQRFVGLKGHTVLIEDLELIADGAGGTRGREVGNVDNCAQLTEEEGFLNGFHIVKGC